jgi:hypothetical protein
MLTVHLNDELIVDGSEFVRLFNKNYPIFDIEKIKSDLIPKLIDDDYVTCFGYNLNIKSTVFENAKSKDLIDGWNMVMHSDKYEGIFESYFELEVYNYSKVISGQNAYLFPILELLKFCYWFFRSSKLSNCEVKLQQVKKQILGKSKVLDEYNKSSESQEAYEDLLNTTSDYYSEMMFAVLSQENCHQVSLNKKNDFVIDSNIAEVKSIHDKFDIKLLDQDPKSLLKMSIPDNFDMNNLKDILGNQIRRSKWLSHMKRAIRKQDARVIFVNATQSEGLRPVSIFMEERNLRKSFNQILETAMSFVSNRDTIPVLVSIETMYRRHLMTSFTFLAPIIYKANSRELDLPRFSEEYVINNIFL